METYGAAREAAHLCTSKLDRCIAQGARRHVAHALAAGRALAFQTSAEAPVYHRPLKVHEGRHEAGCERVERGRGSSASVVPQADAFRTAQVQGLAAEARSTWGSKTSDALSQRYSARALIAFGLTDVSEDVMSDWHMQAQAVANDEKQSAKKREAI